jgi:HNH endonuclease
MPFPREAVEILLVATHRRCCVCHRFCGVKIETDHIVPSAEGGTDEIENAIPLCFDCHAEVHAYNNKHPRGRKFTPTELRLHKARWVQMCAERPEVFLAAARSTDVGPLEALIDELEFNKLVAELHSSYSTRGALFAFEQFHRAVAAGSLSALEDAVKGPVFAAYAAMSLANERVKAEINQDARGHAMGTGRSEAQAAMDNARQLVPNAHKALLSFVNAGA